MAIKGLKNLHYAVIEEEDNEDTTYAEVKELGPGISFNIVPEVNTEELHADDAVLFSDTAKGPSTVTLDTAYLTSEVESELLGKELDEFGGITDKGDDEAPYVAVGGQAKSARGGYEWFWVYRIKFSPGEENKETEEDTPAYQTPSLEGRSVPRLSDGRERWKVWDGNPDIENEGIFDKWFDDVQDPETINGLGNYGGAEG